MWNVRFDKEKPIVLRTLSQYRDTLAKIPEDWMNMLLGFLLKA